MKRNRKAERLKQERLRIRQQKQSDQRVANLAQELGIAGAQILQEEFGFSKEQTLTWFDKMLTRAKKNREESAKVLFDEVLKSNE